MKNIFTEHPKSVNETYMQHMMISLGYGLRMCVAGLACFVHAFFPFLCKKTGSTAARMICDEVAARSQKKDQSL